MHNIIDARHLFKPPRREDTDRRYRRQVIRPLARAFFAGLSRRGVSHAR